MCKCEKSMFWLMIALLGVVIQSRGQSFIKDYPHFVALNTGQSQAVEDLGFSALASPALSLAKGNQQYAVSYRNLTQGDFGLQSFQAGAKFTIQSTQHFGLQARYTGNSAAHILHFSGQYGRKLSDNFAVGTQLNFGQRNAPQYEIEQQLSLDLALWSRPLDQFELGLWVQHLFPIFGSSFENASVLVSAAYRVSQDFKIYSSFYLDVNSDLTLGTGFRYLMSPDWDVKVSYFPNKGAFTLGLGFYIGSIGGHTGSYVQPEFGWQPGAAFFYNAQ
jgi:hypothetical protein